MHQSLSSKQMIRYFSYTAQSLSSKTCFISQNNSSVKRTEYSQSLLLFNVFPEVYIQAQLIPIIHSTSVQGSFKNTFSFCSTLYHLQSKASFVKNQDQKIQNYIVLLKHKQCMKLNKQNVIDLILAYSRTTKTSIKQQQCRGIDVIEKDGYFDIYIRLSSSFQSKTNQLKYHSDPGQFIDQDGHDFYLTLNNLKKELGNSKDSKIDAFLYQHLLYSYRSKLNNQASSAYKQQDYEQFQKGMTEILNEYSLLTSNLQNLLQQPINKKNGEDYYSKIYRVKNQIHPVFVPDLLQLINKNKNTKGIVKDKNAVVLMGMSGVGKSTLAQLMLGYQMKISRKKDQLQTLVTKTNLKEQHKQFIAKASTRSVTKHCSAIKLDGVQDQQQQSDLFLVDCPGFFDSGIVQSSNALSTIEVLRAAASLRFLFVINEKDQGTRGEGLKKLGKMISILFKKYPKSKPIYVLNRYDQKSLKQLLILIKTMKNELTIDQLSDVNFVEVIQHLQGIANTANKLSENKKITIRQALEYNNQVFIMDPLNPNMEEIENKIKDSQRAIKKPKEVIANIIPSQVRNALCRETSTLQRIARKCLQIKTDTNLKTMVHTIKQLSCLADSTSCNDVGEAKYKLDKILLSVTQQASQLFKNFKSSLQNRVLSLMADSDTIKEIKKIKQNLTTLQNLLSEIWHKNQKYSTKMDYLISQTSRKLITFLNTNPSKELIQAIRIFSALDSNIWKELAQNAKVILNRSKKDIFEIVEKQSISKFIQRAQFLETLKQNFRGISEISKISNQFDCGSVLKAKIDERSNKIDKLVQGKVEQMSWKISQLAMKDIQEIVGTLQFFVELDCVGIKKILKETELTDIKSSYLKVKEKIVHLVSCYLDKIIKISQANDDFLVKNIKTLLYDAQISKKNIIMIIKFVKALQFQVNNLLHKQVFNLSAYIKAKALSTFHIVEEKRQGLCQLKQIRVQENYYIIKALKDLTGLINEDDRSKCMKSIKQCRKCFSSIMEEEKQKLHDLILNLLSPSKVIKDHIYLFNLATLMEKEQNKVFADDLTKAFTKILNQIKTFILHRLKTTAGDVLTLIERMQELNKIVPTVKSLKDKQQIKGLERLSQYHIQITKVVEFFQTLRESKFPLQEEGFCIQKSSEAFNKLMCQIIKKLIKVIKIQIDGFYSLYIKQTNQQFVIEKESANKIRSLVNCFMQLSKHEKTKRLLEQVCLININWEQEQIKQKLRQFILLLQYRFQESFQKQRYNICNCILQSCQQLQFLGFILLQNQKQFSVIRQQMRQKLGTKFKEIQTEAQKMTTKQVNILSLKKVYKFYRLFKEGSSCYEQLMQILDDLRKHFQDRQNNLKKVANKSIKSIRMLSIGTDTNLDEILENAESLQKQITDVNQAVEHELIIIKNPVTEFIKNKVQKYLRSSILKINSALQKGRIDHEDIDKEVKILQQLQEYLEESNIDTLKKEFGIPFHFQISWHMQAKIFEKRRERKERFFGRSIEIGQAFRVQFFTLKEEDKLKISKLIKRQVRQKLNRLRSENQVVKLKEIESIYKEYEKLPEQVYYDIEQMIYEKQKDVYIERRRNENLGIIQNVLQMYEGLLQVYQNETGANIKQISENCLKNINLNRKKGKNVNSVFQYCNTQSQIQFDIKLHGFFIGVQKEKERFQCTNQPALIDLQNNGSRLPLKYFNLKKYFKKVAYPIYLYFNSEQLKSAINSMDIQREKAFISLQSFQNNDSIDILSTRLLKQFLNIGVHFRQAVVKDVVKLHYENRHSFFSFLKTKDLRESDILFLTTFDTEQGIEQPLFNKLSFICYEWMEYIYKEKKYQASSFDRKRLKLLKIDRNFLIGCMTKQEKLNFKESLRGDEKVIKSIMARIGNKIIKDQIKSIISEQKRKKNIFAVNKARADLGQDLQKINIKPVWDNISQSFSTDNLTFFIINNDFVFKNLNQMKMKIQSFSNRLWNLSKLRNIIKKKTSAVNGAFEVTFGHYIHLEFSIAQKYSQYNQVLSKYIYKQYYEIVKMVNTFEFKNFVYCQFNYRALIKEIKSYCKENKIGNTNLKKGAKMVTDKINQMIEDINKDLTQISQRATDKFVQILHFCSFMVIWRLMAKRSQRNENRIDN